MKRTFLFLLAVTFLSISSFAQSVIYQDDFEAYTVGDYLAVQSAAWTTWSNAPGTAEDAFISDDYALSPTKSVKIDGSTDLILPLGDKQNGKFELAFAYYIETGYGGYYNLQHYEAAGTEWAVEVYFASDGTGEINADGSTIPFSYTPGTWLEFLNVVDMDNDLAEIWMDGALLHTWQWSTQSGGGAGANQLGGLNVYAGAPAGDDPLFYMDDVLYQQVFDALNFEDFEQYNLGDFIAVVNPTWWETWSNLPGSAEDGPIVDDQAFSGSQSLLIEGGTDLIYKLGDKTAGNFSVDWWMYVPSGFAGYYNFQHYQAPGVEWAIEVYFNTDGTADFNADGQTISFNYTHDTWFFVEHDIDLDNDVAEMYLDGTMIHTWTWSTQSGGGPGANQLGGVDFFAGAQGSDIPKYFADDVEYLQLGGSTDPAIEVDPIALNDSVDMGFTKDRPLNVANVGGADLDYLISVVYDVTTKDEVIIPATSSMIFAKGNAEFEMIALPNPGGAAPFTDDVTLHWDGPNASSVGLTAPNDWQAAAKFPASVVNPYAGMELTKVRVFINDPDPADDLAVRVYGMNLDYLPGTLLAEEAFTPLLLDWNEVTLPTPVPVTGEDLWIACYVNQTTLTHPIGTDAGPAVYNGDWISTGPGWGHLYPGIDANWNIQGILTGTPIEGWLSVDPTSGTVVAGEFDEVTVSYDATSLLEGIYLADLVFTTNDPANQYMEVPVTLTVVDATGIGEDDAGRIEMLVYPNPASNMVNVQSNLNIDRLTIYNHIGQAVEEVFVNGKTTSVNTSNIGSGVYFIRIETANGYITQKLVIK
ncbi:MAG: T9SS type A sorting domain-containing protein [Bacteroidetes bacterium]|nr:T9SS type A sorting domain-containing protein [Bacteroidota bacterium]